MRISVLSDLHCHANRTDGNNSSLLVEGFRVPTNGHPAEALLDLIRKEKLDSDIIVLPGDFTDQADLPGYVVGVHTAREIAASLGAKSVFATLGNHDVDSRAKHGKDPFSLATKLFSDFPIFDPAQRAQFFSKDSGFVACDHGNTRILIINSVVSHVDVEQSERGCFTEVQLENLEKFLTGKAPSEIQIALSHHHPIPHEEMELGDHDLMLGGQELLALLEKHRYHLAIHGHKHHPRFRYNTSESSNGIPVFSAGSFSAVIGGKLVRSLRNTFHIIDLWPADTEFNYLRGIVRSWELSTNSGWVKTSPIGSGISHSIGFGCRKPVTEFAAQVVDLILKHAPSYCLSWDIVVKNIPEIRFLAPGDRRTLVDELSKRNVISNSRDDPMYFSLTQTKI